MNASSGSGECPRVSLRSSIFSKVTLRPNRTEVFPMLGENPRPTHLRQLSGGARRLVRRSNLFSFPNASQLLSCGEMILRPGNVAELAQSLAQAHAAAAPVGTVDLGAMSELLEYHPEDLTVTVQAGAKLLDLQAELARHRQWLPIDPPNPTDVTIDQVLNENLSGPRRFGY